MRFKTFICCLLFSSNLLASNNQILHHTFTSTVKHIEAYHQQYQTSEQQLISDVSYHYIKLVGGLFMLNFNVPIDSWFIKNMPLSSTNQPSLQLGAAQKKFNHIRHQAKHLSHQIYSLERKLKSIADSPTTQGEQKINKMQSQLNELVTQKRVLKPQYDQAKQEVTTQKQQTGIFAYHSGFKRKLFELVCKNTELLNQFKLQSNESISFILKGAKITDKKKIADITYHLPGKLLHACSEPEFSEVSFLEQLNTHYF